jgi:hypothetical protein
MEVFAEAIEASRPGTGGLLFDLSVVLVRDPENPASIELLRKFAELARRVGLGRILVGSDWPTLCSPAEHTALLTSQIPFTRDEWTQVLTNRAPYLD